MSPPGTLYVVAPEDLGEVLAGEPRYRTAQLRRWLYGTPVLDTTAMTNLPLPLRRRLAAELWPFAVELEQRADDGATRKWLLRAPDGAAIEAVLMGYPGRSTLCLSSQAGCAMACTFCATGQFGFERHLDAGEIVAQVAYAAAALRADPIPGSPDRVTNLVFMGMGEPLANYDAVHESLRRLIEVMGIGARSITVSTVGVVPGIRKLAASPWQVNLAISLHAADDELRSELVPLNRRYPIDELVAAAEQYREAKGRRVSIEWTLISGKNDTADQARKLATLAKRMRAHVNVINLNPTPLTTDQPAPAQAVTAFVDLLRAAGVNVTLRDTRGRDIDAACGQLRASRIAPRRRSVGGQSPAASSSRPSRMGTPSSA
jgi:23S rRNA (adenine2503-C2)-methyltransferase